MDTQWIYTELVAALEQVAVQKTDEIFEINDTTEPYSDLGFDSIDGVELACYLSTRLDLYIPEDKNPLYDDAQCRGRTVGQIVEFLATCKQAVDLVDVGQ